MGDFYKILNVTRSVTDQELNRSYRQMAMTWHPNKNDGPADVARKNFEDIALAYVILKDRKTRAIYQHFGFDALVSGYQDPMTKQNMPPSMPDVDADMVFNEFFGGDNPFGIDFQSALATPVFIAHAPQQTAAPQPAAETQTVVLDCSLEDLYLGSKRTLHFARMKNGVEEMATVNVQLRKGWKSGTKVNYPGEGDSIPGQQAKTLVVEIRELPHPLFKREGRDLVYHETVSLKQALTGHLVRLTTLDGRRLCLSVSSIITPGFVFNVESEGMPEKIQGIKGNLKIHFSIQFPKVLSEESRKLIGRALD